MKKKYKAIYHFEVFTHNWIFFTNVIVEQEIPASLRLDNIIGIGRGLVKKKIEEGNFLNLLNPRFQLVKLSLKEIGI